MRTSTLCGVAVPVALTFALAVSACGAANEQPTGGGSESGNAGKNLSGDVKGAGASTQKVAQDAWIAKFTGENGGVSMSYSPIGSGGGRKRFVQGATAYGGTDAALEGAELDKARKRCGGELIEIPVYISPIALTYHLEGVDDLNLTPETVAKIFRGEITRWNDLAIKKANPEAALPDQRITAVHRSDESGTSENFTDYLSEAAGGAWPFEAGGNWPEKLQGESAQGTSGVVKVVKQTAGAITYADAGQVRDDPDLGVAKVKVGDGFVGPTPEAAAKILANSKRTDTPGKYIFTFDLNRDTTASGTYPVVLTSYEMACGKYDSAATAKIVKSYLAYITGEKGQQLAAEQAGSAPITEELREQENAAVNAISG